VNQMRETNSVKMLLRSCDEERRGLGLTGRKALHAESWSLRQAVRLLGNLHSGSCVVGNFNRPVT
jgi:hypothetical protein